MPKSSKGLQKIKPKTNLTYEYKYPEQLGFTPEMYKWSNTK